MTGVHLLRGFALLCFAASTKAYEVCRGLTEILTCEDTGASIGYCCGHKTWYDDPQCCFYTAWWGRWYVWFGVVFAASAIFAILKACVRAAANRRQSSYERMQNAPASNTPRRPSNDLPPSYQQVVATDKTKIPTSSTSNYGTSNTPPPTSQGGATAQ